MTIFLCYYLWTVQNPALMLEIIIPILHACQTFTQLVKVFTTTQHPIDFTARRITVSEIRRFKVKVLALEARTHNVANMMN